MTPADLPIHRPSGVADVMTQARNDMLAQVRDTAREADARFPAAFWRLVDAIEAMFRNEETLLEMACCEALHTRRQDNALLLAALHHAASRVDGGNLGIGRELVAVLPDLLSRHRSARPAPAVRLPGAARGAGLPTSPRWKPRTPASTRR